MRELASALADLSAADALKRLAASCVLERAARMESSASRKEALGCRTVTAALIKALQDTEANVVLNAVIAIAEISRRYFKDDLAYPAVVRLLGSPQQLTRTWAIAAAVVLREASSLPDVLPLARDKSAKVRAEVVRSATGLARFSELSVAARSDLQALAVVAAADKDQQVRDYAANLARALAETSGQGKKA